MTLLVSLVFAGTMALSLWATIHVGRVQNKFSLFPASSGSSGAETAERILRQKGIYDVEIVEQEQALGDHYDPPRKRLVLSTEIYNGTSATALGIAAHECGHAIQDKEGYLLLRWRMASVGLTTFASQIVLWLPLLGLLSGLLNSRMALTLIAGAWAILMLFNLITLPVEFDASAKARLLLQESSLIQTEEEEVAVSTVLRAAAWTYLAAFITSLAYFLIHLSPIFDGRSK